MTVSDKVVNVDSLYNWYMLDELSGTQKIIIALLVSGIIIGLFALMIFTTQTNKKPKLVTLDSGVQYLITEPSESEKSVATGDVINFVYTGKLEDGTEFDSNVGSTPMRIAIGQGQLIAGMEEGIIGMKEKEKRTITIPPDQGYGDQEIPGIPANSTLVFDVQITEIEK